MVVVMALVVAGVAAALLYTRTGTPVESAAPLAPANSVAVIDPATDRMVGWVPVGKHPASIVASGDSVWVASVVDKTITRIDPSTREVLARIRLDATPTALAAGEFGSVWVAAGLANAILQIDPQSNEVFQTVNLGGCCRGPSGIAVDGDAVWVTGPPGTRRVQPGLHPVTATIEGTGTGGALAALSHHIWITDGWETVTVVEPFSNSVSFTVRVRDSAGALAERTFAIGLFGASVLAATVIPLTTAYVVCESFGWESGVSRRFREAPVFMGLYTALIAIGALGSGLSFLWILLSPQRHLREMPEPVDDTVAEPAPA